MVVISQTNIEEPQDTLTAAVVYARDKERQVQFLSSQSQTHWSCGVSTGHFLLNLRTPDFVNNLLAECWLVNFISRLAGGLCATGFN